MKPKTLAVLVVILVLLGGAVFVRQSQQNETSIIEQVDMRPLVPEDVAAADIDRMVVYTGDRSEKKVELVKTGDEWRVASYYDSPVAESKIEPYIEDVLEVTGEFRATAPEDGLADYGLSEDTAYHIQGYTGDQQRFHVLVGKSPKAGTVFMRAAGSSDVHVTNATLKEDAGLFGDTAGMAASPDWWLDKSVLGMNSDDVTAIELTYPDKHMKFEKREIAKAEEGEQADATEQTEDSPEEAAPQEPEYEWVVAEGGLDKTLKTGAIDQLLRKLGSLTATTIVNPEEKDEYSLNPPNYVAKITMADGSEKVIQGGRPEPLKGTYVTLEDDPDRVVYALSRFDFEDLFPFGSDLYDLEADTLMAEDVTKIALDMPEFDALLVKEGETWRVESPQLSLKGDPYKPQDMATTASSLTIKDYAEPGGHYGLEEPLATVTFTNADGSTYTIHRGIAANSVDGHYVSVPGIEFSVVVPNTELDTVFADLPDLYDLTLFSGVDDEAIVRIEIARESGTVVLEDQEMLWKVTSGDDSFNADFDTIDDYRFGLTVLEAESFELAPERDAPEPEAVVTMTMRDGATHTLTIESMTDGIYSVTTSNHPDLVFELSSEDVGRVLRNADFFRPEPTDEGLTAGGEGAATTEMVTAPADPHAGHDH